MARANNGSGTSLLRILAALKRACDLADQLAREREHVALIEPLRGEIARE